MEEVAAMAAVAMEPVKAVAVVATGEIGLAALEDSLKGPRGPSQKLLLGVKHCHHNPE